MLLFPFDNIIVLYYAPCHRDCFRELDEVAARDCRYLELHELVIAEKEKGDESKHQARCC